MRPRVHHQTSTIYQITVILVFHQRHKLKKAYHQPANRMQTTTTTTMSSQRFFQYQVPQLDLGEMVSIVITHNNEWIFMS